MCNDTDLITLQEDRILFFMGQGCELREYVTYDRRSIYCLTPKGMTQFTQEVPTEAVLELVLKKYLDRDFLGGWQLTAKAIEWEANRKGRYSF